MVDLVTYDSRPVEVLGGLDNKWVSMYNMGIH